MTLLVKFKMAAFADDICRDILVAHYNHKNCENGRFESEIVIAS